jgi:hypothetical protein
MSESGEAADEAAQTNNWRVGRTAPNGGRVKGASQSNEASGPAAKKIQSVKEQNLGAQPASGIKNLLPWDSYSVQD